MKIKTEPYIFIVVVSIHGESSNYSARVARMVVSSRTRQSICVVCNSRDRATQSSRTAYWCCYNV